MRAALALIVNHAAVSEQRPVVLIESGQIVEGQVVHQHRGRVGGVVRAARHVDDLDARHRLMHAQRAGGIRFAERTRPPSKAQAPTAMVAAALRQTFAFGDVERVRPPMVQ
jgi:hypothetical protein